MTRTATCILLVAGLLGLSLSTPRSSAQNPSPPPPPPPWDWDTYTKGVNPAVEHYFPAWGEATVEGEQKMFLTICQGYLKLPQSPQVSKVTMRVYREGSSKGVWEDSPAIVKDSATIKWKDDKKAWLITADATSILNPQYFKPKSSVKFTWWVLRMNGTMPIQESFDVYTTAENIKK